MSDGLIKVNAFDVIVVSVVVIVAVAVVVAS
jgi:hypothetical protein